MPKHDLAQVKPVFAAVMATVLFVYGNSISAEETFDLAIKFPTNSQVRVASNIDHVGDVVLYKDQKEDEKKSLEFLPLTVNGKTELLSAQHQR